METKVVAAEKSNQYYNEKLTKRSNCWRFLERNLWQVWRDEQA